MTNSLLDAALRMYAVATCEEVEREHTLYFTQGHIGDMLFHTGTLTHQNQPYNDIFRKYYPECDIVVAVQNKKLTLMYQRDGEDKPRKLEPIMRMNSQLWMEINTYQPKATTIKFENDERRTDNQRD